MNSNVLRRASVVASTASNSANITTTNLGLKKIFVYNNTKHSINNNLNNSNLISKFIHDSSNNIIIKKTFHTNSRLVFVFLIFFLIIFSY